MHIARIADYVVWHMQQDSVKASATSQCVLWLSQSRCVRCQGYSVMSQNCCKTNQVITTKVAVGAVTVS